MVGLTTIGSLDRVQERGEQWSAATETQLCFEMKTFLLAGHETSSAMLAWTLYELSQDREKMLKVGDESPVMQSGALLLAGRRHGLARTGRRSVVRRATYVKHGW